MFDLGQLYGRRSSAEWNAPMKRPPFVDLTRRPGLRGHQVLYGLIVSQPPGGDFYPATERTLPVAALPPPMSTRPLEPMTQVPTICQSVCLRSVLHIS